MKKITSLLLTFVLIIAFSGCGGKKSEKKAETGTAGIKDREITVLYSKTDGFNPYTQKSMENRELSGLLFDPLINLKSDFTAEFCIALSADINANTCTVRLKDIKFTDGTPLTSEDVIYSFNLAKASVYSGYAVSLEEIIGAQAPDLHTVIFTAAYFDPYILNLLTFPIIKNNTAGLTDSDGVELSPVGSGKYIVSPDETSLMRNEEYWGKRGAVKTVKLLNAPDAESEAHYVEAGKTDIYYTEADTGQIVRMSAKRTEINLNRMIYIGINSTYGALSSKEMRYAISSALDRKDIAKSAYYGTAKPASSFYNPALKDVKPSASLEEKANIQITVENLSKLGYNVKDSNGFYLSKSSNKRLSFKLLVNSDNVSRISAARLIAVQCKAAGIEIIPEEVTFEEYKNRLYNGDFQLYLGETEINPNMDMAQLTCMGGAAAYGVYETASAENMLTVSAATTAYRSGSIGISDLSGVLLTEMPQIPLCYRNGLLFYGDKIKSGVEGIINNIYYSIENYTFKK